MDTKRVHHPYTDALVVTVRVAKSKVHRMLLDNGNIIDIPYWGAYKKMGMVESDLSAMISPLYEFTGEWENIPKRRWW